MNIASIAGHQVTYRTWGCIVEWEDRALKPSWHWLPIEQGLFDLIGEGPAHTYRTRHAGHTSYWYHDHENNIVYIRVRQRAALRCHLCRGHTRTQPRRPRTATTHIYLPRLSGRCCLPRTHTHVSSSCIDLSLKSKTHTHTSHVCHVNHTLRTVIAVIRYRHHTLRTCVTVI